MTPCGDAPRASSLSTQDSSGEDLPAPFFLLSSMCAPHVKSPNIWRLVIEVNAALRVCIEFLRSSARQLDVSKLSQR